MNQFQHENIKVFNDDCMKVMSEYPDKYFDLAIVDPGYGIGVCEKGYAKTKKRKVKQKNGKVSIIQRNDWPLYDDKKPDKEYFELLKKKSKNQIIWGGNYFTNFLDESKSWIVWDKCNGESSFGDCELAWTSFDTAIRKFTYMWSGMFQGSSKDGSIVEGNKNKYENRIHPNQKPIQLYKWIYKNYSSPGQKILDTHLGSGSNAIAAHYSKITEFVGCELKTEFFSKSIERIQRETRQLEFSL